MSGIDRVPRLHAAMPALKIIMLTVFEDSEQVFNSLSAGAFGYLMKSNRPAKILQAIREVHEGGSPMSSHIARTYIQRNYEKLLVHSQTEAVMKYARRPQNSLH
jgi:DNA-binding NarL/FixJ family response regulator